MKYIHRYFFACFILTAPMWAQLVSPVINSSPSREFGQPKLVTQLVSIAPNLVEGRELNHPTSIAFDTSVSPPIMYVVDQNNNRVLAWKNATSLGVCGTSNPPGCGFADLVIGQKAGDKTATLFGGPSAGTTALTSGLSLPSAVAVDSSGNVYIADAGNNRILRFPAPFNQTSSLLSVDLVIGQASQSSGFASNAGLAAPTAKTLALASQDVDHVGPIGMAFDSAGNLWVPDIGNDRVLRFPVASLAANTAQPAADLVLGQFDFVSSTIQPTQAGTNPQLNPQSLAGPSALVFDQAGHLYVSDALLRVLYYAPPISTNGLKAQRILGVNQVPDKGQTAMPYPNSYTLGLQSGNFAAPPFGVAVLDNHLYVTDTYSNRIAVYDTPDKWPAATATIPSPQILSVIGQPDLVSGSPNGQSQGKIEPDATVFGIPLDIAFTGTDLWVVDSENNRVMSFPQMGGTYTAATRLVGQLDFPFVSVNLIEGRELFLQGTGGLAVDLNSNPPHMYVADTGNNRVLGFLDARKVKPGSKADIVIGQTDFFRALINSPTNNSTTPNDLGLNHPAGLVVDANGDLFVADSRNGRVLRFPAPFSVAAGSPQRANLVLGQSSFTAQAFDPSEKEMHTPFGVAFLFHNAANDTFAVSDPAHNRVLMFERTSGQDFTNFQAASVVLGQPDFFTTTSGPGLGNMNNPLGIGGDSFDRLYVCDTSNNRVVIFTSATEASSVPATFAVPNLTAPQSVTVNQITGEFWVANSGGNDMLRFPDYDTLVLDPNALTDALVVLAPLSATLDKQGNLIVAEASNRVTFFFAAMYFRNAASYNIQGLAPGMLAAVAQLGKAFNFCNQSTCASSESEPWKTMLSDLQLTANGIPAPIFRVDSGAIYFQVPMNVCGGPVCPGTGEYFELTNPSTGAVVAAGTFAMVAANPAFFSANSSGIGNVAARNDDLVTANSPTNPVGRGKFISLYLTGQGYVPGAPPDGVSPSGPVFNPPSNGLTVLINALPVDPKNVLYSGLGGFPGGWVINVIVPESTPPGAAISVVVVQGPPSNILGQVNADGTPANDIRMVYPNITTIAVK